MRFGMSKTVTQIRTCGTHTMLPVMNGVHTLLALPVCRQVCPLESWNRNNTAPGQLTRKQVQQYK